MDFETDWNFSRGGKTWHHRNMVAGSISLPTLPLADTGSFRNFYSEVFFPPQTIGTGSKDDGYEWFWLLGDLLGCRLTYSGEKLLKMRAL